MLKQLLKNKLLLIALINLLLLIIVVMVLSSNVQKTDKGGDVDYNSSTSGGLEIVQEDDNSDVTSGDSVNAPSSWSGTNENVNEENDLETQGSTVHKTTEEQKKQTEEEREEEQQDKDDNQNAQGISDDESFGGDVPFGRIF